MILSLGFSRVEISKGYAFRIVVNPERILSNYAFGRVTFWVQNLGRVRFGFALVGISVPSLGVLVYFGGGFLVMLNLWRLGFEGILEMVVNVQLDGIELVFHLGFRLLWLGYSL